MPICAVIQMEPNREVQRRIEASYPEHFRLSPTFTVVATKDVPEGVAVRVGIQGEGRVEDASGVVFRLKFENEGELTC